MKNKIVVLAGFSGTGKDSIADILKENGYNFITSHTTRPMRDGESEGNPYWFIDKSTMLKYEADGVLIECRKYNTLVNDIKDTWYYAVHETEVDPNKPYVVVLDMLGLKEFKEAYGDRVQGIFVHTPDEVREERAKLRGSFDQTEWDRRLEDDRKEFPKEMIDKECDFVVHNIELERAAQEVLELIS